MSRARRWRAKLPASSSGQLWRAPLLHRCSRCPTLESSSPITALRTATFHGYGRRCTRCTRLAVTAARRD
ncbi:hypothetical protein NDU88_002982 [Pleurodeles waltl]|uniref:Uncharacterized protein n=1 Tax=Pleurodeles waltl TaxID=8319 RepID=A0AAV7KX54_PLEWA|nr:hypothetical protein NDU88_002982 [Pleurodeles waltl]